METDGNSMEVDRDSWRFVEILWRLRMYKYEVIVYWSEEDAEYIAEVLR